MSAASAALGQFATEFADNLRLRYGVWAIAAILLIYLALLQNARLQAAHADYAAEATRLQRAATILERDDWSQLLADEREAHGRLEQLIWRAESEGLAQAQVQSELKRIVEAAGLRNVLIRSGTSQPLAALPDVWRVQIRVTAGYSPGGELQLLHALATLPRKVVVDRLEITRSNSRLALLLSAYFIGFSATPEGEQ